MVTQLVRNVLRVGIVALMAGVVPPAADAQTIEACFHNSTGLLRVVSSSTDCKVSESSISWNVTGPPGTITPPLILSADVPGGVIQVENGTGPGQFGITAFGGVVGLVGRGITGVSGEGETTGVAGRVVRSASRGGFFESAGGTGTGVVGMASATSIPGTGVQGVAPDAVFVPPGAPNPVVSNGVRGSGYLGVVGRGRETASPGFADMAFQGAGVQGFGYFGVFGRSANGFAGFFEGNVRVTGELSATTLNQSSDRSLKENFAGVDKRRILRRLGDMPIHTWNYTTRPGIRHVGPTAQDFYQAFGLGGDDRHITTIDESGVALVATQSLYELHLETERVMSALREELNLLKAEVDRLRSQQGSR